MKKIILLLLISVNLVAQEQVNINTNKTIYEFGDTAIIEVKNPNRISFGACHQDINYAIEKWENGSWDQTQYNCCQCDMKGLPDYFFDSIGLFKIRGSFMWQPGKYRLVLTSVENYIGKRLRGVLDSTKAENQKPPTFYSNAFYVLPPKLDADNVTISSPVKLSYYENSKIKKGIYYPNSYVVIRDFVQQDSMVFNLYCKNLKLHPMVIPKTNEVQQDVLMRFDKVNGEYLFRIAKENVPKACKYVWISGLLMLVNNNQVALTNRLELELDPKIQSYQHDLSKWLESKNYKYFINADYLDYKNPTYPFKHSYIDLPDKTPEELFKIAQEFIEIGYFSKVTNVIAMPKQKVSYDK